MHEPESRQTNSAAPNHVQNKSFNMHTVTQILMTSNISLVLFVITTDHVPLPIRVDYVILKQTFVSK